MYRWLLRLHPPRARRRYGDELEGVARAILVEARADGRLAVVHAWLMLVMDALRGVPAAWLSELRPKDTQDFAEGPPAIVSPSIGENVWTMRRPWCARRVSLMESIVRELIHGAQRLRRAPGLTVAVIATLALGIGVNTSVFSVVYGVLLRPMPYPEPDELVTVWMTNPREGIDRDVTSYPNLQAWRERNRSFEQLVAVRDTRLNLVAPGGDPEEVRGQVVTEGFFEMLGVGARLGRTFTAEEQSPDGRMAVVLSHGLWATRFGSDPAVIGRTIELSGATLEIVGVMPPDFSEASLWIPQRFDSSPQMREQWGALWLPVMGRLADGVSIERAQEDMTRIAAQIEAEVAGMEGNGVLVEPRQDASIGDVRAGLLVLLGAVVVVLLIACANIANLVLSQASARRREFAVRVALGAGRASLLRHVLADSMLLALVGGIAGFAIAVSATDLLVAVAPADLPRLDQVRVDAPVLLFTLATTLVAGLLFGLAPAWHITRRDPAQFLAEGGRGDVGGRDRVRPALVVGQFALALALLAGAALLMRSFRNLQSVDPGFTTERVLSVSVNLPGRNYGTIDQRRIFWDGVTQSVDALPGVESTGLISNLFLSRLPQSSPVFVEGGTPSDNEAQFPVAYDAVTPELFETIGLRLESGRVLSSADDTGAPTVGVVNEAFVRRYLPGAEAVGRRFAFGTQAPEDDEEWITIAGVIEDARRSGLDVPARPYVFFSIGQYLPARMTLLVRTAGDPIGVVPGVREVVRRIDPVQPLSTVRTVDQLMLEAVATRRFVMLLLGVFAVSATLLAAVGIHGVLAFAVGRRTREIGVRMALGAKRRGVLGMVVGQAMRQALAGLVIGVIVALAAGRFIRGQLFGISETDPLTFLAVALVLLVVAGAAAWIPAWRAATIDPLEALRDE
jgi:putative ABC transport system permease protein